MADETEDTLEERLESVQRRAENFRELLKDGEEVTIAFLDGDVHVEESYRSKFERLHPKLYGRLLSIEAQMSAGWSPYVAALLLAGSFIFGLQLSWWTPLLGETACDLLNLWWFFLVLPVVLSFLATHVCAGWGAHVYRRHRAELLQLIAAAELDRDLLLVMLKGEEDLENVVYRLKLDTGPFPQP
ncbi:MAG: hypothetical protein EXR98_19380 [Gemmataceae bacterium]|nr:hypothetical protein [Gemmataceae bacterium]